MSRTIINVSLTAACVAAGAGAGPNVDTRATTDPPAATVAFTSPAPGQHAAGGVPLAMVADGVTIEPAGDVHEGAGHFHVIADRGCLAAGDSIVKDADHVHFGGGQTEGVIYLEPGIHELCLQVGDGVHVAADLTATVTVDVGVDNVDEWCAVVGGVDERFTAIDGGDDEFATQQLGYESIRRLVAQLRAGLEFVDESARADVGASLAWVTDLVNTLIWSRDAAEAATLVEPVFQRMPEDALPGADWILERCGVDVNG